MLIVINHPTLSIFKDANSGEEYKFQSIAEALEFSEAYHKRPISALFAYYFENTKQEIVR